MSSFKRWPGLSLLAIAIPIVVLSCGEDDDAPDVESVAGQAGSGGGSAGAESSETAGAGGATPTAVTICGMPADTSQCSPITGAACDIRNGETCDYSDMLGGFKCFTDSTAKAGEFCDNDVVFCGVGTFCNTDLGLCQHYCCADQDCGEGICFRGYFQDGAADPGICSYEFGGGCLYELEGAVGCDAGGAGAGGAGGTSGAGGGNSGGTGG